MIRIKHVNPAGGDLRVGLNVNFLTIVFISGECKNNIRELFISYYYTMGYGFRIERIRIYQLVVFLLPWQLSDERDRPGWGGPSFGLPTVG